MNWPVIACKDSIEHAADILRAGGVVAFPTETYYGLAVDPFNHTALERLFRVKCRPRWLPILVLIAGVDQLPMVSDEMPVLYRHLIDCFWPGPLTLVFKASPTLPSQLTGGTGTIGVRQSPHPTASSLLTAFGGPLTATSANISGFPAAISASDVARMFDAEIDLIIDGGLTPGGAGSTLVGIDLGKPYCIREGKIKFSEVRRCVASLTRIQ